MAFGPQHPVFSRREMLQTGSIGLMGLSLADVAAWRSQAAESGAALSKTKAVIFIFLSGGPPQHETFDMKPNGPSKYRGEFNPIATRSPGVEVCEHLPLLAQQSHLWATVRSLAHTNNDHHEGTHIMLTGRSQLLPTFRMGRPQETDWPAIASVAGSSTKRRNNLPPSVVLPENIYHPAVGVFPGQFGSLLGKQYDPWFVQATGARSLGSVSIGAVCRRRRARGNGGRII